MEKRGPTIGKLIKREPNWIDPLENFYSFFLNVFNYGKFVAEKLEKQNSY